MAWVAMVGLLATAAIIALLFWSSREPQPTCPNCGHQPGVLIGKDPTAVGTYDRIMGDVGGGAKEIVTTFRLTYRCPRCQHKWTRTQKDWNQ